MTIRRSLATVGTAATVMAGVVGLAAPAQAQPVVTGGLVNVTITDVLSHNDVSVQIPIGVAATVCGVQANVLATGNVQEPVDCRAATQQDLPVAFR